jgi:hypothetical protein
MSILRERGGSAAVELCQSADAMMAGAGNPFFDEDERFITCLLVIGSCAADATDLALLIDALGISMAEVRRVWTAYKGQPAQRKV